MPGGPPRVDVLVLAAGQGERLGLGVKAFLNLGGTTLLERAIASCRVVGAPVFAAVPKGRVADAQALCPGTTIVEGGATRSETLRLLLDRSSAPYVLIHDVVHPFASAELFRAVLAAVEETGAAIASLRPTDFVYRSSDVADGRQGVVAERVEDAWIAQSPKAFRREILARGYGLLDARGGADPGSLELVRLAGGRVVTVPGDVRNIKITTPDDLRHAESLIAASAPHDGLS